jgi:hypothetical protein
MTTFQKISTTDQQSRPESRAFTFQSSQLVWLFLGLLEAVFMLRLVLLLAGANPAGLFTFQLYSFTGLFLYPFSSLVGNLFAGDSGQYLATLLAMALYAVLGGALERLLWGVFYRPYATLVSIPALIVKPRLP